MIHQLETALEETVHEVPFNSFGKILLADGEEYPRQLGGNCVLQNRILTEKLASAGVAGLQYTTAKEKPHWVSLARDDGFSEGDLFMMDPFVMHNSPINMTEVMRSGQVQQAVHPLNVPNGVSSHILAKAIGSQEIEVQLHAPRPNNPASTKHVMTYTYDLSTPFAQELPPNNYQLLAGVRQKMLELGVLRPSGGVSRVYVNPENGDMNMLHVGQQKISRPKQQAEFDRHFAEIAAEFRLSAEELFRLFGLGREAYLRRAPTASAA
jgi:hypothetical protein